MKRQLARLRDSWRVPGYERQRPARLRHLFIHAERHRRHKGLRRKIKTYLITAVNLPPMPRCGRLVGLPDCANWEDKKSTNKTEGR